MNEETEELDDSLVNIKGDVYELTNGKVSIMEDPDTYKSTYQVLQEISKVWDELTDKQQAQLLDKLFGKTRAQIGASIISNFSQAEAAIKTMSESAGAADREMDIITNSLEYKLNAIRETFTGIWQNLFNREDLGNLLDFVQPLLNGLDVITEKLGLFKTAIAGLAIGSIVKNFVTMAKDLGGIKNISDFAQVFISAFPNVSKLGGSFKELGIAIKGVFDNTVQSGTVLSKLMGVFSSLWGIIAAHPFVALAAGIGIAYVAFQQFNNAGEKAKQNMENAFSTYEESKQKTEEIAGQLEDINGKIDAIQLKGSLTFVESSELEKLSKANELLQEQYNLAVKQEEINGRQAAESARESFNKNYSDINSFLLSHGDLSKDAVYKAAVDDAFLTEYSESNKENLVSAVAAFMAAQANNDSKAMQEISDIAFRQLQDLGDYKAKLTSIPENLLTVDQKTTLDTINQITDLVWQVLDESTWKQMNFDAIYKAAENMPTVSGLVELAKAAEGIGITADQVEQLAPSLVSAMKAQGFTVQELVDAINSEAGIFDSQEAANQALRNFQNGRNQQTDVVYEAEEGVQKAVDALHKKEEELVQEESENPLEIKKEADVDIEVTGDAEQDFLSFFNSLTEAGQKAVLEMQENGFDFSAFDTSEWDAFVSDYINKSNDAQQTTLELTGTLQDLQFVFSESSSTGITKAITDYKTQMASLIEARNKWNKGELTTEDMVNLQSQIYELNNFDMSNFGTGLDQAIARITGQLDEVDNRFKDFKENIIEQDSELSKAMSDIASISKQQFKDALSGRTELYASEVNAIASAAQEAGLVNLKSADSVDGFVDSLYESGIMLGKVGTITKTSSGIMKAFAQAIELVGGEATPAGKALIAMRDNLLSIYDATEETTTAYNALKETLTTFTDYQSTVDNALKASRSGTGLTTEEVKSLTNAYKGLDDFNPKALFEQTANGIHLNEEEFKRLNQEVKSSTLTQMYADLAVKCKELEEAQAAGLDTSGLEQDIIDAQMLIAQYEGLTSAYSAWASAKSSGNERDSFESIATGYKDMKEIFDAGWFGDESLNAYLDLLLSASARTGDTVTDFERLSKTIEGTGRSLLDYFTFDGNNKLVTDGLFDFIKDVNTILGDEFAKIELGENGEELFSFDFSGDKLQQVAEAFGTSTEFIQLMERAMIDAGMAIEMSSSEVEVLKESLTSLQEQGAISPDIDLSEIDIASMTLEEIDELIGELDGAKAKLNVETDQEQIEQIDRTMSSLNSQKITKSIQLQLDAGSTVEDLLALEDADLANTLNIDTSQVDEARQKLQTLSDTTEETSVTVKLDQSQFDALTNLDKEATVTYKKDSSEPDEYKPDDKAATVKYSKDSSIPDAYKPASKSATVRYIANTSGLPTTFATITRTVKYVKEGAISVDGTAHARGTAFANGNRSGNWGTRNSGVALGGELGEELIIRDGRFFTIGANSAEFFRYKKNDIIFNAEQTKQIFEKGLITHGDKRGTALVEGTAFDSGSGGRRRTTTTTSTTPTGRTSSGSGSSSSSGRSSGSTSTRSSSSSSTSSDSSQSEKDEKDTKDFIDWIEIKLKRIEREIDRLNKKAGDTFASWSSRSKSLKDQIQKVTEEIELQNQAYDRYMKAANAVGLSSDLMEKVKNGTINIEEYDEETREKINQFKEWYEKALDCKDALQELGLTLKDLFKEEFDNIITRWTNALQNLQHTAERTESLISRRNAYASDYVTSDVARDTSKQNINDYIGLINNAKEQRKKLEGEYLELNKKLEEGLKNGTIAKDSEAYYELLKKIQDVENELDNVNKSIIDYSNSISEEYVKIFDSVSNDYDNQLSIFDHLANQYNTAMEKAEAKGRIATKSYYEMLKSVETQRLQYLNQEYVALKKALDAAVLSGEIQEGSQAWYDMVNKINAVSESIHEAELNVLQLDKSIREVKWEQFEYMEEQISQLADEAKFLIDLLSNSKLVDDKGGFTNEGLATMGLHGQNYNTLMLQADDYAAEIMSTTKEMAEDPYNTDLIAHRQELYEAQQRCILAAEEEKQAIKSLIEEGIKVELSSLKDLIKEYTNALDSQKELYDFQKKISDQTKKLASLRKQLMAYENDLTEETRAKVQKIRVQIEEAEEDIRDTEYDKYIKEQKKLLDSLYAEYEKIINERLDNIDFLIEEAIATINDNASVIGGVISQAADAVGYTLSDEMKSIWLSQSADNQKNLDNRIVEFSKLLTELVNNGAISKENADKIMKAISGGTAESVKSALKIIQGLIDNGNISKQNAVALMTKLSAGDSQSAQNALNIVQQLRANGALSEAEAVRLLNGIVLQDSNSRKDAISIITSMTANGKMASTQASQIIAGLASQKSQDALNASNIVTRLLANGKITQDEASRILLGIVSESQLEDLYAKDAVKRLTEEGKISKEEAAAIIRGIESSTNGNSVLATYSKDFANKQTTVNNTVSAIKQRVERLIAIAEEEARKEQQRIQQETKTTTTTNGTPATGTKPDAKQAATNTTPTRTNSNTASTNNNNTPNKPNTTTPSNKPPTLTDDIRLHVAAAIWNGNYGWTNDPERNGLLEEVFGKNNGIQAIVNKGHDYIKSYSPQGYSYREMRLKFKGYSSGLKRSPLNELAWTNESWDKIGGEAIVRASDRAVLTRIGTDDRVYSAMSSGNLWDMANNPSRFIAENMPRYMSGIRAGANYENNVSMGDVNMNFPSVKNYEEFVTALQKDRKFEKMIQNMTLGASMGRNNKNNIHWN